MTPEAMVLSFTFYSMLGWLYESTICSLHKEKKLINRGFLLGPYCPVYGVGAVLSYLTLHAVQNPLVIFLAAAVLCSVVEYVTGWGMETLFHAKWWDYSNFPFQLHGRICLYGACLFGAFNVVICRWAEPTLLSALSDYNPFIVQTAAVVITLLMATDAILTLVSWGNLNQHLCSIRTKLQEKSEQTVDNMSEFVLDRIPIQITDEPSGLQVMITDWNWKLKKGELRFLYAFPNIRIFAYDKFLQKINIKEHLRNVFERF